MPVGLQAINEASTFQIDGLFPSYVLARIVDVATTSQSDVGVVASRGSVAKNNGEIVALRSDLPCAMISIGPNTLVVSALGPIGSIVRCYFFEAIRNSNAVMGLQVFNEQANLMYCASNKPIRFIDFRQGTGSFSYDTSKVYAAITMNQYYSVSSDTSAVGGGRYFQRLSMERSRITNISGGIKISNEFEYAYSATVTSPVGPPPPLPPNQTSQSTGYHAFIDVTGY